MTSAERVAVVGTGLIGTRSRWPPSGRGKRSGVRRRSRRARPGRRPLGAHPVGNPGGERRRGDARVRLHADPGVVRPGLRDPAARPGRDRDGRGEREDRGDVRRRHDRRPGAPGPVHRWPPDGRFGAVRARSRLGVGAGRGGLGALARFGGAEGHGGSPGGLGGEGRRAPGADGPGTPRPPGGDGEPSAAGGFDRPDGAGGLRGGGEPEILLLAAGGFRDLTRLAASSPHLWSDILLANGDAIVRAIDLYVERLTRLRTLIDQSDAAEVERAFGEAKRHAYRSRRSRRSRREWRSSRSRCPTAPGCSPR